MMLFAAILAAATETPLVQGLPPEVAGYAQEASGWVLSGQDLPRDYRVRLLQMEPSQRLQAIIFLRRAGLLSGKAWTLDDILRPAQTTGEKSE